MVLQGFFKGVLCRFIRVLRLFQRCFEAKLFLEDSLGCFQDVFRILTQL